MIINNNKKELYFVNSFILLVFILLALPFVYSYVPILYINETGEITNQTFTLSGTFSPEYGYGYQGFFVSMGNYSYFNRSVLSSDSLVKEYNRSFDSMPFIEKHNISKNNTIITISYNLTNHFSQEINVSMNLSIPSACAYHNHSINESVHYHNISEQHFSLFEIMSSNKSLEINISCQSTQNEGYMQFYPAHYKINTTTLAPDFEFSLLPDAFFSVEKNKENVGNASGTRWKIGFSFVNSGDVPVSIDKIHLWATPITNTTNNPDENKIFDMNYSSCENRANVTLENNETCLQSDYFNSVQIPVMWSEVFYSTIWDFDIFSNYTYTGQAPIFLFDTFFVLLESPENNTYLDTNKSIELAFNVSEISDCELYTNRSGIWKSENMYIYNTTKDAFEINTSINESKFIWNVFCQAKSGIDGRFGYHNYTANVNSLHQLTANISDISWSEDTNYTLNISSYFGDVENDTLKYSFLPDPVVNISILVDNNSQLIEFIPDVNYFGERLVRIIAHDSYSRSVESNLFLLNVTPVDDPPKIVFWNITNGIWWTTNETNITAKENQTLTFSAQATDPDKTTPWYNWFLDGVFEAVGNVFNWYLSFFDQGMHNVTLIVNDSSGLYDLQTWIINVTNVNIAPNVTTIPNQAWKENTTHVMNLSNWFTDIDAEDQILNYSIVNSYLDNLSYVLDNDTGLLYLTPDTGWIDILGSRWMILNGTDSHNHSVISNNFSLSVYPWILSQIPNVTFEEDMYNDTINLSNYYNKDNYTWDNLSWGAFADHLFFNMASNGILNITSQKNWFGNDSAHIVVINYNGWNDSSIFNVEILPINDPPTINDSTFTILENTTPPNNWVDLWNISFDVDNDYTQLNYVLHSQSNTSLLNCTLLSNRYLNCTSPPLETWGESKLNVSVSDGEYNDSAIVTLEVFHYNLPPLIEYWNVSSDEFYLDMFGGNTSFNLIEGQYLNFTVNVSDYENDTLYHNWFIDSVLVNTSKNAHIMIPYNTSGERVLRYIVNQSQGLNDTMQWNLSIINKNRAPYPIHLTNPPNGTFKTELFTFNWTKTTDPDAYYPNKNDFWDFVYILQVDNNPNFFSPELDVQFKNTTSYDLDELLEDDLYYWRVLAYDGLDSSSSEVFELLIDINEPFYELNVEPNPAEFGLRNVSINWLVSDKHLEEAYVNVSYPNGTLLVQTFDNETLTPAQMTKIGNYNVTLFGIDLANHSIQKTTILQILNDTQPPEITLISPQNNSVVRTNSVIFGYSYEDINELANCSLYLQKINAIYDVEGGLMHFDTIGNYQKILFDKSIEIGNNYFAYPELEDDSYLWNVLCYDVSGNYAFADSNHTFRIITSELDLNLLKAPGGGDETPDYDFEKGYNIKAKVYPVFTDTSTMTEGYIEIENIGDKAIYDLTFLPSVDWVYFDKSLSYLRPGDKTIVPFKIDSPLFAGEYLYHVALVAENLKVLVPGSVKVNEPVDVSLRVNKRVYVGDENYNVSFNIINYLKRDVRIYVEDSIDNMEGVIFSEDDFYTPAIEPPILILNKNRLGPRENINVSYLAKDVNLENIKEPLVITDENYMSSIEVIYPHNSNMQLHREFSIEYILVFSLLVIILLFLILYWIKTAKEKRII